MRHFRIFAGLALAVLCAGSIHAQNLSGTGPVSVTGGSSAQTMGQALAKFAEPYYFSGFGNTLAKSLSVTVSNGGTTLAVGTAQFASTDCQGGSGCTGSNPSKLITVQGAGTPSATGSISNIPVSAHGSRYNDFPVCGISDTGGGLYATCAAEFQLDSGTPPTIATGGTGYPASSTFNATLSGPRCRTAPVISVTTNSSGVITSVASIVTPGQCTSPPGNNNSGWTGATIASYVGAPGGTGGTFNVTYNVVDILILGGGTGYGAGTITPTLTGGSPSVAATLGTPTTTTPSATWSGTITGFIDSQHVTVTPPFNTALSSATERVVWGNDDCTAITAAMNAVGVGGTTNGGALWFHSPLNGTMYGTSCPISKPEWPITFFGDNPYGGGFIALAPMAELMYVNDSAGVGIPDNTPGFASYNMRYDGNGLTPITMDLASVRSCQISNNNIVGAVYNATFSANLAVKPPGITTKAYECHIDDNHSDEAQPLIGDPSLMPQYGFYMGGTDNHLNHNIVSDDLIANIYDATFGANEWSGSHSYGFPFPGYIPQYCGYWAGTARVDSSTCDGAGVAAYHIGPLVMTNFRANLFGSSSTLLEVSTSNAQPTVAIGGLATDTNTGGLNANLITYLATPNPGDCIMGITGALTTPNFCPNASIPVFTSTANGLAPASGGGTTNYLRADGTWAAPGGGGGAVSSVFGRTGAVVATTGDYSIGQIGGTGTAATVNTGTSGATIPLNNGSPTESGTWTFSNPIVLSSLLSQGCLGTNSSGAIVAGTCTGGSGNMTASGSFTVGHIFVAGNTSGTSATDGGALGTAAAFNTGTSGGTLGLLNGNNTTSGNNTHNGTEAFANTITLSALTASQCLALDSGFHVITQACSAGDVTSFNSRTGAVVPTSGDYSFSLLSGSATSSQIATALTTPGPIGGTTPNTGSFTNATVSGTTTLSGLAAGSTLCLDGSSHVIACPVASAYYVAASGGSDSNACTTTALPCATIAHAVSLASSGSVHLVYLLSGTYSPGSPITFTSTNNGVQIAEAPGATAIIDGGSSLTNLFNLSGTTGMIIGPGLTFQNVAIGNNQAAIIASNGVANFIRGDTFVNNGQSVILSGETGDTITGNQGTTCGNGDTSGGTLTIYSGSATVDKNGSCFEIKNQSNSITVSYNVLNGPLGSNTGGGCVYAHGMNFSTVTHNFCENSRGMGFGLEDFSTSSENNGNAFTFNIAYNTDVQSKDSGAFYALGRTVAAQNTYWDHNLAVWSSTSNNTAAQIRAFYFDDCSSSNTGSNLIAYNAGNGNGPSGAGSDGGGSPTEWHGGSNNSINNMLTNITPPSTGNLVQSYGLSGNCSSGGAATMTGNSLSEIVELATQSSTFFSVLNTSGTPQLTITNATIYTPTGTWSGTSGTGLTFSGLNNNTSNPGFTATYGLSTTGTTFTIDPGLSNLTNPPSGYNNIATSEMGPVGPGLPPDHATFAY